MERHPIERFQAPSHIRTGNPLKALFNHRLVELIGASFHEVMPEFDQAAFLQQATQGLDTLEMKARAKQIAEAMATQLSSDFSQAAKPLIRALGPKLTDTEGYGLSTFFYMPHSEFITHNGAHALESGLTANYELTQRSTAEFSIRPLIVNYPEATLERLQQWTTDPNPHVRRLVSEGTRPLLPWGIRLKLIQAEPQRTVPLLETLKDDPELYVRRSVANHLGDHAKQHLALVLEICEKWLEESKQLSAENAKARRWIIRHALRYPAKKENAQALELRAAAK